MSERYEVHPDRRLPDAAGVRVGAGPRVRKMVRTAWLSAMCVLSLAANAAAQQGSYEYMPYPTVHPSTPSNPFASPESRVNPELLPQDRGWFYDAHRALVDCHALLQVLAGAQTDGGTTGLFRLMAAAAQPGYRLRATGAPFEAKDRLKENALSLSGGQQQRLCIARAIAGDPEVLLLDEPCSALDPIATGKIEDLIQTLKGTYTILIVTHNMQQASRTSDYTAFMYLGHVIEYGPTTDLFMNPLVRETQDYITGRFG